MAMYHNIYRGLGSGPFLREAGVGGSNPLTPTNKTRPLTGPFVFQQSRRNVIRNVSEGDLYGIRSAGRHCGCIHRWFLRADEPPQSVRSMIAAASFCASGL